MPTKIGKPQKDKYKKKQK